MLPVMTFNRPAPARPGTLITVAPTGAESDKASVPALPVTLDELTTTAVECRAAGAAVIHVHIRDGQARPTLNLARLKDTVQALRDSTDLIVQLSTGGAVTDSFDDRLAVLEAAPDACSLTCGTVNFGDEVFANPWPFIRELYARTRELAVVPEFELFDLGHVATLRRLLDDLGAPHGGHVHCDLVLGVRPEHVRFDDNSKFRGTVFGAEYLGTTQIVTVNTEHGQVKARLPADVGVSAGEIVGLRLRSERLSLFDKASGRSIHTALTEGGAHG